MLRLPLQEGAPPPKFLHKVPALPGANGVREMNEFNDMSLPAQRRWGRRFSRRMLLSLPIILAAASVSAAEPHAVGTVSRLAGAPTILRGGQQQPAERGMALREGDRVVTGTGGRLEIAAADGSTIIVGEQTTVVLTRLVLPGDAGPGQGLLDLVEGILRFSLPGSWNRFEVITATAVASVRGTEWLIDAKGSENTAVFVAKGSVEVETPPTPVPLSSIPASARM